MVTVELKIHFKPNEAKRNIFFVMLSAKFSAYFQKKDYLHIVRNIFEKIITSLLLKTLF